MNPGVHLARYRPMPLKSLEPLRSMELLHLRVRVPSTLFQCRNALGAHSLSVYWLVVLHALGSLASISVDLCEEWGYFNLQT